jgi:hypothetical protein
MLAIFITLIFKWKKDKNVISKIYMYRESWDIR